MSVFTCRGVLTQVTNYLMVKMGHDLSCTRATVFLQIRNGILFVAILLLWQATFSAASSFRANHGDDYDSDVPTESPDLVETFNPMEWVSRAALSHQIEIQSLKLNTQIKIRYARTRISIQMKNPHDKELQTDFKIILPENAFFTIFQLKTGKNPKTHTAQVVRKDDARNIFHFARTRTNGTVSAGYIELSPKTADLPTYNLKFTVAPRESIQSFLVYERQLDRVSDEYTDRIQVFPVANPLLVNSTVTIGLVEFAVNVEELENVRWLRCAQETEENFSNCNLKTRKKGRRAGMRHKFGELTWKERKVMPQKLQQSPFRFAYQLERQNDTTTAVVISQHNGNLYFLHLLVPENLAPIPKHIIFLLDVSDSMYGKKLEQLQWSMTEILEDLGPNDYFNIVAFSNDITTWTPFRGDMKKCQFPYPATEANKNSAAEFIDKKLNAHGTTNIFLGLSDAFDLVRLFSPKTTAHCSQAKTIRSLRSVQEKVSAKLPENVESMIFFLSDGQPTSGPTDTTKLLRYFTSLNHNDSDDNPSSVQIHTIAYGGDADVEFLRALASMNGGVFKVIAEESAAGVELTNVYHEISLQVLSQVQTSVASSSLTNFNGSNTTSLPLTQKVISSPVTVIKGGEVLTAGELFPGNNRTVFSPNQFNWSTEGIGEKGKLAYYNSPVYNCITLEMSVGHCVERIDYYLERLQAYQLLRKLLERDRWVEQGYICPRSYHDQFQDLKMERLAKYSEEDDQDVECYNNFRQQAIELALKHGFVTPYTSFILTTEKVDSGLENGNGPGYSAGTYTTSDDDSVEHLSLPPSSLSSGQRGNLPEKLIIIGSVSPMEKLLEKPASLPDLIIKPEVMPNASRLIGGGEHRSENVYQDTYQSNATTNSTADKPFGFATRFMQQLALKVFKKAIKPLVADVKQSTNQTHFNSTTQSLSSLG